MIIIQVMTTYVVKHPMRKRLTQMEDDFILIKNIYKVVFGYDEKNLTSNHFYHDILFCVQKIRHPW